MTYFDFSPIQPFDFEQSYNLEWAPKFPGVAVSVEGTSNPLVVGKQHPWQPIANNLRYFNLTGKQDIKTLMHSSCGATPSSVNFNFLGSATSSFLLVVYGLSPEHDLKITSLDPTGTMIFMNNWEEIDNGILNNLGMNGHPLVFGKEDSARTLTGIKTSPSYVVLKPNVNIRSIKLTVANKCVPPKCAGTSLYYALIAIGDC
eukprot:gene2626-3018_t